MNLKINLEDERLCMGCPFHNENKKCNGGHLREAALLLDKESFVGFSYTGQEINKVVTKVHPIRPQSCLMANETAVDAVTKIPTETMLKSKEPKVKKILVCSRCQGQHKPHERCKFVRK